LSQESIKNVEHPSGLRTVLFVIEIRQATPSHVRDTLLLAVSAGDPSVDHGADVDDIRPSELMGHLDVVDVLAIAATMITGNVQALAAECHPADRGDLAGSLMAIAGAYVPDRRSVAAIATIVGASGSGDLATGAAIARCLAAFRPDELTDAAVALLATTVDALADLHGVPLRDIVAWAAGDAERPTPARPTRPMFCTRDAVELHPQHH
jgi:hypothetical protein